jgi:cytochrome P460
MFVVEERMSSSKGSINKTGQFQTDLMGIGVEVKDETRFPERWAYFNFDEKTKSASPNPKAACWQCHEDHAAVEHSFAQFYPTLKPVAQKFGTYKDR